MIKIKIDIEVANRDEGQTLLEHIAEDVSHGYSAGQGWTVKGEDMNICLECGIEIDDDVDYCGECNELINGPADDMDDDS